MRETLEKLHATHGSRVQIFLRKMSSTPIDQVRTALILTAPQPAQLITEPRQPVVWHCPYLIASLCSPSIGGCHPPTGPKPLASTLP